MFGSAFWASPTFSRTVGTNFVEGVPLSEVNAVPRWRDTGATMLGSTGVFIDDDDNLLFSSGIANVVSFTREGAYLSYLDPGFKIGSISVLPSYLRFNITFFEDSVPPVTVMAVTDAGEVQTFRTSSGMFSSGFFGTQVNRSFGIGEYVPGIGIGFGSTADIPRDTAILRDGPQSLGFYTGPDESSLTRRAYVSPSVFGLASGVVQGFTERLVPPAVPPAGEAYVYFRSGVMYRINSAGTEVSLEGGAGSFALICPVFGRDGNQNSGYLPDETGIFSNVVPFYADRDLVLERVVASCGSATNDWLAQVLEIGNPTPLATVTLADTDTRVVQTFSVAIPAGTEIGVYLAKGPAGDGTGPNIVRPNVRLYLREQ